jgi:hypothetical protein
MEAPVEWIFVLGLTVGAHWENAHGRLVAIIGNILDDREAWATVGAIDEGIAIAPVGWIKEFAQAIITGSGVG